MGCMLNGGSFHVSVVACETRSLQTTRAFRLTKTRSIWARNNAHSTDFNPPVNTCMRRLPHPTHSVGQDFILPGIRWRNQKRCSRPCIGKPLGFIRRTHCPFRGAWYVFDPLHVHQLLLKFRWPAALWSPVYYKCHSANSAGPSRRRFDGLLYARWQKPQTFRLC